MNYSKELIVGSVLSVLFFIVVIFQLTVNDTFSKQIQTNITPTPSSQIVVKMYSVSDVAKHNSKNDCWLIVSNKVYDASEYLLSHPGGTQAITQYCGKDATAAFKSIKKHGSEAQANLTSIFKGLIN